MAAADTARLIASLELDPRKFNAGVRSAQSSITRIDRRLGAFSGALNRNLGRLVDTAVTRGARLLVGGVQDGIDSLVQLENATTSVDGAIKQMGLTGQVTSGQIAQWANEIEAATQAAFDDKDITRNAAVLIRYGRVAKGNLRPALQVMTDLAAKTGSVDSAATKLAKALADPTKAARLLREVGRPLNKEQEKLLKTWMKQGKVAKAQAFILQQVGQATKNAARDGFGPLADAQHQITDAMEDTKRAFATAFLPVILKVSGKVQDFLARQDVQDGIRRLGENLAGALDKAIAFAEKIDWDKVGKGLETAAGFAGDLLEAFTKLDPKVQGSILGILALDRVGGGIITDIGKGILTAVIGGGVVAAIKALFGGGRGGGGGGGGGGTGTGGGGGTGTGGTAAVGVFVPDMHQFNQDIADRLSASGTKFGQEAGAAFAEQASKKTIWDDILINLGLISDRWTGMDKPSQDPAEIAASLNDFRKGEREAWGETTGAVRDVKREQAMAAASLGQAIGSNESTTRSGLSNAVAATNNSASRITGAIAANRPIVTTIVDVDVTSTGVAKANVTTNSYGPTDRGYGGPSGKYDKPGAG